MAARLACGADAGERELKSGEGAGDQIQDAVGIGRSASIDGDVAIDVERGPVAVAVGALDGQVAKRRTRRGVDDGAILDVARVAGVERVSSDEIERGVVDGEGECGGKEGFGESQGCYPSDVLTRLRVFLLEDYFFEGIDLTFECLVDYLLEPNCLMDLFQ